MKISALINTLNEEKNIEKCLQSLSWVDEIILVDMYSDDKTIEIAKKYTDDTSAKFVNGLLSQFVQN